MQTSQKQNRVPSEYKLAFTHHYCLTVGLLLVIYGVSSPVGALFSTPTVSSIPDTNDSTNRTVLHKLSPLNGRQFGDMISDIQIECNSESIVVNLNTNHGFKGMIYPKGLSKNSSCMTEYHQSSGSITYYLPLRSCNTMSSDVEDGVEYFNTLMVQPHRRLVTNQGRGYHIRCRYQTKERTITNQEQQLSVNLSQATPAVVGSASMPTCSMRIYSAAEPNREVAAENVRIGDELKLVIALDSSSQQEQIYGMLVTNCLVRDGMNWGEQPLLDDNGCPVDEEILPQFKYAKDLSSASVTFQAHKFPYTASVYYQCNVRLCFRDGGCRHVPPNCSEAGGVYSAAGGKRALTAPNLEGNSLGPRHRRWIDAGDLEGVGEASEPAAPNPSSMSLEVFSGLSVAESAELSADQAAAAAAGDSDPMLAAASTGDAVTELNAKQAEADKPRSAKQQQQQSEKDFCLSLRKFAIAISLISLILMALILLLIACLIQRRKARKERELREQQLSINDANNYYSHQQLPYSNRGYCRD